MVAKPVPLMVGGCRPALQYLVWFLRNMVIVRHIRHIRTVLVMRSYSCIVSIERRSRPGAAVLRANCTRPDVIGMKKLTIRPTM